MKKFAFILTLVSLVAHAEVVYEGRFGSEGSTGESSPKKDSIKSAAQVYKALSTKPDSRGAKTIQISDESSFSCQEPYSGASRLSAGCYFLLRESQNVKVKKNSKTTGSVTFSGALATKIHSALPADPVRRVGASVKSVGNLSCSKSSRPGSAATCTISNTNVLKIDTES